MRFDVLKLNPYFFGRKLFNSSQIPIHKSASTAFGPIHLSFPRPNGDHFVINVNRSGTDTSPDETQKKAVSSALLTVR